MQSKDSQKIVGRFYEALAALIATRAIRGKKTFTDRYGINRWNFITVSRTPTSDMFQPAWLTYLVEDYGVSALWLLTGAGEMFAKRAKSAPATRGEEC